MTSLFPPSSSAAKAANAASTSGGSRPPRPVAAVLADRLDDVPVVDAAARLAVVRGAPLLLIAVLPPLLPRAAAAAPEGATARAVLGRALPRLARAGVGFESAVCHRPAGRGGRLCAARGLLDVAIALGCSRLVVSRSGPEGLEADTVMEAAAIRGGPFVHAAPPLPWVPLAAPRPLV